jgi:hypothetical protein
MQEQSKMQEMFAKFSTEQGETNRNMTHQLSLLTTELAQLKSIAGSYRPRTDSNDASWNEPTQAAPAAPVYNNDPKLEFCKLNLLVTIPIQQLRTFNGTLFIDAVNKAIAAKLSDPNTTSFKENLEPENVTLVQRAESRSNDKATFRVRLSDERLKYTVFWIKAMLRHQTDLAWIISEELTPLQKQAQQQKWSTLPSELRSKGVVTWLQGLDLWCRPTAGANTKVQILSHEHARSIIENITAAQAPLPQSNSAGTSHLGQRPASATSTDPSPAAKRPYVPASGPTHTPAIPPPESDNTHTATSPVDHTHMTE